MGKPHPQKTCENENLHISAAAAGRPAVGMRLATTSNSRSGFRQLSPPNGTCRSRIATIRHQHRRGLHPKRETSGHPSELRQHAGVAARGQLRPRLLQPANLSTDGPTAHLGRTGPSGEDRHETKRGYSVPNPRPVGMATEKALLSGDTLPRLRPGLPGVPLRTRRSGRNRQRDGSPARPLILPVHPLHPDLRPARNRFPTDPVRMEKAILADKMPPPYAFPPAIALHLRIYFIILHRFTQSRSRSSVG